MADANAGWGAPKLHSDILKLGFAVSERTVARDLQRIRPRGDPAKRWHAFLRNHRKVIVAFDFFTVPTIIFRLLYCFFVIEHGRRKVRHFNVTRHPTAELVVQQLREAFLEAAPYKCLILDIDSIFNGEVTAFLTSAGLERKRTSIQAPWQNGTAERWVGSARGEMLDQVILLNEAHLRRLIREYVDYYHDDRLHDSLEKDSPSRRPIEAKPNGNGEVIALDRVGGLHHCFTWRRAASTAERTTPPPADPMVLNGTRVRERARSKAFTTDSAQHAGSLRPAIPSPYETFRTKPIDFAVTERCAVPPTSIWLRQRACCSGRTGRRQRSTASPSHQVVE